MVNPDWSDILKRVRSGDKLAFGELITHTQTPLFTFCLYLAKNRPLAEDILHDTYLKAFEAIGTLKNADSVLFWLKQIARRHHLDIVRSGDYKVQNAGDDESYAETEMRSEMSGVQRDAMKVLNQLPEQDRLILVLIDIEEHSYEEAAAILAIPVGTIKSRLFRAREKFSSLYGGTKTKAKAS